MPVAYSISLPLTGSTRKGYFLNKLLCFLAPTAQLEPKIVGVPPSEPSLESVEAAEAGRRVVIWELMSLIVSRPCMDRRAAT
jgi:hypothetical protein